ncbi:MAG: hypothetical protein NVSMB43_10020 [Pseudarthrobacter sp.]
MRPIAPIREPPNQAAAVKSWMERANKFPAIINLLKVRAFASPSGALEDKGVRADLYGYRRDHYRLPKQGYLLSSPRDRGLCRSGEPRALVVRGCGGNRSAPGCPPFEFTGPAQAR